MRLDSWLAGSTGRLIAAGIDSARLDCLLLLEAATGQDRAWLLAHPELELTDEQITQLDEQVSRRAQHTPLAYIRGHVEFYGRQFFVNEHVLVPRPETEAMVSICKDIVTDNNIKPSELSVIDVGTGSGARAVTVALELPGTEVIGLDIDPDCLAVANKNAQARGANCSFVESDLLGAMSGLPIANKIIVLANLPYVPDNYPINRAAGHEPALALFAGPDGLEAYRRLWQQAASLKPSYVITEALLDQHQPLAALAQNAGYALVKNEGLAQCFAPQQM